MKEVPKKIKVWLYCKTRYLPLVNYSTIHVQILKKQYLSYLREPVSPVLYHLLKLSFKIFARACFLHIFNQFGEHLFKKKKSEMKSVYWKKRREIECVPEKNTANNGSVSTWRTNLLMQIASSEFTRPHIRLYLRPLIRWPKADD